MNIPGANNLNKKEEQTMSEEQQSSGDSWDGLLINYLKAENLKTDPEDFACVGIKISNADMDLELERSEEKFVFSLNTTNKVFLKNAGITKPKEVIGKRITLKKVMAFNPSLKKEVDSLRISKIE